MKPMMWMGRVSGIAGVAVGALFAAIAAFQLSKGELIWPMMLAAALLLTGSWRTLRRESGGLRLLCGAWGVAGGLSVALGMVAWPYLAQPIYFRDEIWLISAETDALLAAVISAVSFAGLALTVLHKEK